jgi:phosphate-selective porin OprO/OprP
MSTLVWLPAILRIVLATAPAAQEPAQDEGWSVRWRNGTQIESPDGDIQITIGGRIQFDVLPWVDGEGTLAEAETGSELRRARLHLQGRFYDRFLLKAELDFATPDEPIRDVYMGIEGLGPAGTFVVGHFKEPLALDIATSNRYLTFPERPGPLLAFAPERNFGAMLFARAANDRVTWKGGVFQDTDDNGEIEDGSKVNFTGRVTGLPIFAEEGKRLLHLGVGASLRDPPNGQFSLEGPPELHLLDDVISTPSIPATEARLLDLEAALVLGPFHAQGELIRADVSSAERGDPTFGGHYVQVGYILTGEHRRYTSSGVSGGAFDRLRPSRPIERDWALGAWEVAVRYSNLDLDSEGVDAGEVDSWSATLNWYLNSWARTYLTYIDAEGSGGAASGTSARALVLRFGVDF